MIKDIEEIKKIINYSDEFQDFLSEEFELKLIEICNFINKNYSLVLIIWLDKELDESFIYYILIKSNKIERRLGFNEPLVISEIRNNKFVESKLLKQINNFQLLDYVFYRYDFNHDGNDDVLSFTQDNITGYIHFKIYIIDMLSNEKKTVLDISCFPFFSFVPEFINYKNRQGIKYFDGEQYIFYYYDRILQKYIQDEQGLSEELEKISGSPDFFAEAGIDYTKLERPLLPADLEGFSKPALRIWRNAVYARHGRIFKSEELQSLFNEYAWYESDETYTDEKLSDVDRMNIELIRKFEEKNI